MSDSVTTKVSNWLVSHYEEEIAEMKAFFSEAVRHGCFCGPGTRCHETIDELDGCCQQHDDGYRAVGHSHVTMWTVDGWIATAGADAELADCAEASGHLSRDDPHSNSDPDEYRSRLIFVFRRRAQIGRILDELRQRYRAADRALDDFADWLRDAVSSVEAGDPASVAHVQETVAYLTANDLTEDEIGAALHGKGIDPAVLAPAGAMPVTEVETYTLEGGAGTG